MLTLEDKFAITELINLYAHIIDRQEFSSLGRIFTPDAVFDLRLFQAGKTYRGLEAIEAMMATSEQHPVAHHATNVVIKQSLEGFQSADSQEVIVESKGFGIGRNGRVGSVVYTDTLVKRSVGWRIRIREVQHLSQPGEQR